METLAEGEEETSTPQPTSQEDTPGDDTNVAGSPGGEEVAEEDAPDDSGTGLSKFCTTLACLRYFFVFYLFYSLEGVLSKMSSSGPNTNTNKS